VIGAGDAVAAALRRDGVETAETFDAPRSRPDVAVFVTADLATLEAAAPNPASRSDGASTISEFDLQFAEDSARIAPAVKEHAR
jgi:hypothetical protein